MRSLAAVFLLLSAAAIAEEPEWYTVEMIIFERLGTVPTEYWPFEPGSPEFTETIELFWTATGEPRAFTRLGARDLELGDIYRRLQSLPDLNPVLHIGWRQPGYAREEARTVHLRSSDPGTFGIERVPTVEGTARLHRSRYLHLLLDLRYHKPAPSEEQAADADPSSPGPLETESADVPETETAPQVPVHFRLTESRRMRSRELHYIDHPLFGVIVQIIPYEQPAASESPSPP